IFTDYEHRTWACDFSHPASDHSQNVIGGAVINLLRCVDTQPIKMEFLYPISRICQEVLSNGTTIGSVKVDGGAPFAVVSVGKVVLRKLLKVISIWTQTIVNDIEDNP